jgi:hypothetical protein
MAKFMHKNEGSSLKKREYTHGANPMKNFPFVSWGGIISHVQQFYEQAVSDLDP